MSHTGQHEVDTYMYVTYQTAGAYQLPVCQLQAKSKCIVNASPARIYLRMRV